MTFPNRNQGGSGVYARSLLAAFRERPEFSVSEVAGPSRSDLPGTLDWLLRGAGRALREQPCDLLHCPSFVAPWALPVPYVVTVHDAGARRFPADHPLEWRVYDRALMPGRLRSAARVIVGSEFSRREVIGAYGLDPERAVAIPYGVDPRFFEPLPGAVDSRDATRILFPGAPVGRKNIEVVLRALAAAASGSALGRVTLEISGARSQDFPAVVGLCRDLGVEDRVRWLGQVPHDALPALLQGACAIVYPSLSEGFGFPPLEAMAVGTPVVASDRGSLPEILGEAALVVDPTDPRAVGAALEAVLTRPELRQRLEEAGRKQAARFSWTRCAELTARLYEAVLAESRSGPR